MASIHEPSTRARVLRAFEAMPKAAGHRAMVVTRRGEERISEGGRTIDVVPARRWLLGLVDRAAVCKTGRRRR